MACHRIRPLWTHLALAVVLLVTISCAGKLTPTPEPVTIRFAYRQRVMDVTSLIDAFHAENPWINVELVAIDRSGGDMSVTIQDKKIDVFREDRSAMRLAEQGLLMELDELQLESWSSIRQDYYRGTWEGLVMQGQQWGIPAGVDKYVVYVQDDVLKILKRQPPPFDWSLSDFIELASQLNYPEGLPNTDRAAIGFCTSPDSADATLFVYLHGGKIVDSLENPTRATLDDPLTIEAVEWYASLFGQEAVAPDPQFVQQKFRTGGLEEALARGMCGLRIGFYSGRGGLDTPYAWTFGWRMLPLPRDKGEFGIGNVEGYYLTKNCAHPAETLKFVRFLSDHLESAGHGIPPRRSLVESEAFAKLVGDDAAAVARAGADSLVILPMGAEAVSRAIGIFLQAVNRVINEGLEARPVLEEAQDACEEFFQ